MQELPKRKQIRIKDYDYSKNGCYFITMCTQDRIKLLSEIINEPANEQDNGRGGRPCPPEQTNEGNPRVKLSPIGKIIEKCWRDINIIYPNVKSDYYIIMPDHIHGIIEISDNTTGGQGRPPLQKIVQGFKSVTTRMCFEHGYRKLWQRNYYEHIIRNENEYLQTIEYIMNNPIKEHLGNEEYPW